MIPALYIRDLDPDSLPARKNTDLLMERSPVELVKTMGISTDKGWKSNLALSDESTKGSCILFFRLHIKTMVS